MPPKRSALSNRQFRMLHRGVCTVGQQIARRDQASLSFDEDASPARSKDVHSAGIRGFRWCSSAILIVITMKEHAALLDSWTAAREPENESHSRRGTKVSTRVLCPFFLPAHFITVYRGDRGPEKDARGGESQIFPIYSSFSSILLNRLTDKYFNNSIIY